jgi:hypothetical protein
MTDNTPSPAPGLEECVEWLDSLRITDITWSANEFERIREIVHATKHHLQSLRPAQPAPTVQRWNPGVTWLNDRAAEPEMFESDIGTFVRWIDHVAALRAASAASATYTQEQLDAAKWRAHELLRGLTLDPPRACPCCANQPPASGLSEDPAYDAKLCEYMATWLENEARACVGPGPAVYRHDAKRLRQLATRLGKGT